jgi:hypothetical protein
VYNWGIESVSIPPYRGAVPFSVAFIFPLGHGDIKGKEDASINRVMQNLYSDTKRMQNFHDDL